MLKGILTVSALSLAAACAGQTSSTPAGGAEAAPRPATARANRNVISREELSTPSIRAMNALEVIRSLRPTYLAERGKTSQSNPEAGKVHASLDYNGVISLNDLRNVPVVSIVEILYLDVAAAMNRFGGAANEGPVIVVRTH